MLKRIIIIFKKDRKNVNTPAKILVDKMWETGQLFGIVPRLSDCLFENGCL